MMQETVWPGCANTRVGDQNSQPCYQLAVWYWNRFAESQYRWDRRTKRSWNPPPLPAARFSHSSTPGTGFRCTETMDTGNAYLRGTMGSGGKFPVPPLPIPKQCQQDTQPALWPQPTVPALTSGKAGTQIHVGPCITKTQLLLVLFHTPKAHQTHTHLRCNRPSFTPLFCPIWSLPAYGNISTGWKLSHQFSLTWWLVWVESTPVLGFIFTASQN